MSDPQVEPQSPDSETSDSFLSHLFELRDRLIRALIAIAVVFVCLFPWAKELYALLAQPLLAKLPQGGQMIATDVVGVFLVPMKVALMVAFLIALPYVLYQVWAFIAPGLYAHEKKLALPMVGASVLLFFIGMSFAYFLVFPTVFGFMAKVAPDGVAWMTDIEKYLSFVMTTFLAFGVTFEVPVVFITAYPERFLTGERPEPAFLISKPFQPAMVSAVASQALFFQRNSRSRPSRATAS